MGEEQGNAPSTKKKGRRRRHMPSNRQHGAHDEVQFEPRYFRQRMVLTILRQYRYFGFRGMYAEGISFLLGLETNALVTFDAAVVRKKDKKERQERKKENKREKR